MFKPKVCHKDIMGLLFVGGIVVWLAAQLVTMSNIIREEHSKRN